MKTSCVSYDTFDARESKRVLPEEQSLVACPVEAKTLIVSRMNTPDRVGACGFVADNWPNLFLPDRLWRVRLRNSVDPYLVYVLLTSDGSKKVLRGMASGTSGSMHNIPKESFLDMELALPTSLEEQSKIAKQFASLDNLITLHQRKCQYHSLCGYLLGNSVSWVKLSSWAARAERPQQLTQITTGEKYLFSALPTLREGILHIRPKRSPKKAYAIVRHGLFQLAQ